MMMASSASGFKDFSDYRDPAPVTLDVLDVLGWDVPTNGGRRASKDGPYYLTKEVLNSEKLVSFS